MATAASSIALQSNTCCDHLTSMITVQKPSLRDRDSDLASDGPLQELTASLEVGHQRLPMFSTKAWSTPHWCLAAKHRSPALEPDFEVQGLLWAQVASFSFSLIKLEREESIRQCPVGKPHSPNAGTLACVCHDGYCEDWEGFCSWAFGSLKNVCRWEQLDCSTL